MRLRLSILILAAALPIALFAAFMVTSFEHQQKQSVEDRLRQAAVASLRLIDDHLTTVQIALETLAISGNLNSRDYGAFADKAQQLLDLRPDWYALTVRALGGPTMTFGFRAPKPSDYPAIDTDAVFRYGATQISEVLIDPNRRNEPMVAVSVPVIGNAGVTHVLTAYIRAWGLNRTLRDQGLIPGWRIALLDTDGKIIAHTRSEDPLDPILGTEASDSIQQSLRLAPDSFFYAQTRTGDEIYSTAAISALSGWTLILGVPAVTIEQLMQRAHQGVIGGGAAALILATLIGWSLIRAYGKRQQAENRLLTLEAAHAAERRTAAILESTTDNVFELDRDWRITFINRRARDLITDSRDVTGQNFWDVFPDAVGTGFWQQYQKVLAERHPVEFEEFHPPRDAWFHVRAFPSGDGGIAVYFQDITQRRRAEEAMRRTEARFRVVFEQAAVGIERVGLDGRVLEVNGKLCDILGATAKDLEGRSFRDFTHPDDLPAEEALVEQLLAGKIPSYAIEKRYRRKDGESVWVRVTTSLARNEDGSDRHRISIIEDITGRKRIEADLERSREESERANHAKTQFLAAVSHDLRQPVQSLFFLLSTLARRLTDDTVRELVAGMQASLNALKLVLDGMLDISRLDAGVIEPRFAEFRVHPLLKNLERQLADQAAEKGLSLRVVESRAWIRSDPVLLEWLLRNLIENAIRYTDHGGIVIGCRRNGPGLRIDIVDSGIGIPEPQTERIFQEFVQLGNPERDRAKGLGLGLAIVHRLSNLLGQPVTVRSRPGHGSRFSVSVPVARPLTQARPELARIANDDRGLALVIDDEAIILMGLRVMLESWGWQVMTAASANEALAVLKKRPDPPDVIVADYRLRGGHTGTEAIREVHGACRTQVPAIVLTGDTSPDRIVECERSGYRLLHKPITEPDLRRAITEVRRTGTGGAAAG
jgi:PAS domain S-box-containing protein